MEKLCQKSKGRSQKQGTKINFSIILLTMLLIISILLIVSCTKKVNTEQENLQNKYENSTVAVQPLKEQPSAVQALQNQSISESSKIETTEQKTEGDDLDNDNLDKALNDLDQI